MNTNHKRYCWSHFAQCTQFQILSFEKGERIYGYIVCLLRVTCFLGRVRHQEMDGFVMEDVTLVMFSGFPVYMWDGQYLNSSINSTKFRYLSFLLPVAFGRE